MVGGSGNNNIRRGASGANVVVLKMENGREGIIKKMSKVELEYLQKLQGDNVVKILQITDEGFPIMEKLKHIDLYNDNIKMRLKNSMYGLKLKYNIVNENNRETLNQEVIMPSPKKFKYLLDLLNAIERVNTMGICLG